MLKIHTTQFISILFSLCITLVNTGCFDICDVGEHKCEGNKIYQCVGSDAEKSTQWSEFRDCDDFNATCVNGITTEYNDYSGGYKYESSWDSTTSSCVNYHFDCQGIEGERCIDTNRFVVNCVEHKSELVGAVAVDNWDNRPYCVIVYETAVFAQLEETYCEEGAMQCIAQVGTLECLESTWQWVSRACIANQQ